MQCSQSLIIKVGDIQTSSDYNMVLRYDPIRVRSRRATYNIRIPFRIKLDGRISNWHWSVPPIPLPIHRVPIRILQVIFSLRDSIQERDTTRYGREKDDIDWFPSLLPGSSLYLSRSRSWIRDQTWFRRQENERSRQVIDRDTYLSIIQYSSGLLPFSSIPSFSLLQLRNSTCLPISKVR